MGDSTSEGVEGGKRKWLPPDGTGGALWGTAPPVRREEIWCQGPDIQTDPVPPRPCLLALVLTSQPHVDERVINQHQFVEVKLVREPFPLGLVQNAFVVIIAVDVETPLDS